MLFFNLKELTYNFVEILIIQNVRYIHIYLIFCDDLPSLSFLLYK